MFRRTHLCNHLEIFDESRTTGRLTARAFRICAFLCHPRLGKRGFPENPRLSENWGRFPLSFGYPRRQGYPRSVPGIVSLFLDSRQQSSQLRLEAFQTPHLAALSLENNRRPRGRGVRTGCVTSPHLAAKPDLFYEISEKNYNNKYF